MIRFKNCSTSNKQMQNIKWAILQNKRQNQLNYFLSNIYITRANQEKQNKNSSKDL
jgi:hypothetical protein